MNNQLIKIKEKLSKYNTVYKRLDIVLDMVDSFDLNKKDIKFLVPEVKMFDDIVFKPHSHSMLPGMEDAVQGVVEFDNGRYVSVVGGGRGLYGDGKTTFEIGHNDIEGNFDVIGWLTRSEITDVMLRVQVMPPIED